MMIYYIGLIILLGTFIISRQQEESHTNKNLVSFIQSHSEKIQPKISKSARAIIEEHSGDSATTGFRGTAPTLPPQVYKGYPIVPPHIEEHNQNTQTMHSHDLHTGKHLGQLDPMDMESSLTHQHPSSNSPHFLQSDTEKPLSAFVEFTEPKVNLSPVSFHNINNAVSSKVLDNHEDFTQLLKPSTSSEESEENVFGIQRDPVDLFILQSFSTVKPQNSHLEKNSLTSRHQQLHQQGFLIDNLDSHHDLQIDNKFVITNSEQNENNYSILSTRSENEPFSPRHQIILTPMRKQQHSTTTKPNAVHSMFIQNSESDRRTESATSLPWKTDNVPFSRPRPSQEMGMNAFRHPLDPDGDGIVGLANRDYPVHNQVPKNGFSCRSFVQPGYYVDIESNCQVFYICQIDGRQDGFLCPNGSVFHQKYLVCDWWFNVRCSESTSYFRINSGIPMPVDQISTKDQFKWQSDRDDGNAGDELEFENNDRPYK